VRCHEDSPVLTRYGHRLAPTRYATPHRTTRIASDNAAAQKPLCMKRTPRRSTAMTKSLLVKRLVGSLVIALALAGSGCAASTSRDEGAAALLSNGLDDDSDGRVDEDDEGDDSHEGRDHAEDDD
jgi:hypothetical protein